MIGHGRDLRQVCDADDLLGCRELGQLFADALRRDTGHTRIHLVEHHGGDVVPLGEHVFQCQHDARQLAAGGNFTDAPRLLPGVGGDQKLHHIGAGRLKTRLAG